MDNEKEKQAAIDKALIRDKILLSALKLFAKKGYFNTSLTDIKEEAELKAISNIYQHFTNKQAIAIALYQHILDSLGCSIDDIRRRNRKPSEQLREIVDLLFSLTDNAPDVVQFLLVLKVEEFLPEEKPLLQTQPFEKIKKVLFNGIKANEIRSVDALLAYTQFFGIINHTLVLVLNGELPKKASHYQAGAWMAAWGAIVKK